MQLHGWDLALTKNFSCAVEQHAGRDLVAVLHPHSGFDDTFQLLGTGEPYSDPDISCAGLVERNATVGDCPLGPHFVVESDWATIESGRFRAAVELNGSWARRTSQADIAIVPIRDLCGPACQAAPRDAAVVLACAAAVLDRAAAGAPDPLRYADAPPARPPVLASPDVLALMEILENCAAPPSPAAAATLRLRLAEELAAAFVHENRRDQRDAGAAAVGRHPDPAPAFSLSAAELLASPELI